MTTRPIYPLSEELGIALKRKNAVLVTAESCTGGWLSEIVTAVPGCSAWFDRAYVCYSNQSKVDMLGLDQGLIEQHGAVSEAVVKEMAKAALQKTPNATVSIAISGIAGPGGETPEKPVGTIWIAWAHLDGRIVVEHFLFKGERKKVRSSAVEAALKGLISQL